jgi:diguanylate cyclase (GGDEF)-like protein
MTGSSGGKLFRLTEGSHFNFWFVLSIAITIFLMALLAWHLIYSNQMVASFERQELGVQKLSGELLRYTKSLEMAANMAAATGDLKWEIEYRDYRARLDNVFMTIPVLVETPQALQEIENIKQYRQEIDDIENDVLALVARGEKRAAADLLAGWVYTKSQLNIIVATDSLANIMNQHISQRIDSERRLTSALLIVLAVCLLVLIVTWLVTITIWRANVKKKQEKDEEVRYLSYHDSLTGLSNRAFFEAEMQRIDSEKYLPVSIIMLDFNSLKLVNDTYGHEAGDEVLKSGAELLRKACRESDILSRWGGDEFIILLPRTSEEAALSISERIVKECRKTYGSTLPVSMALGAATKTDPAGSLSELIKTAENNMYNHKLSESCSARSATLEALLEKLYSKSNESEQHTRRLKEIALLIGSQIDLPASELKRLELLANYHDIGMLNISEEILKKPEPLSADEWTEIKRHPETGYRIVRSTQEYDYIAREILCHHEAWDGSGYPEGLEGSEIPLLSRIITIADAFEVMSSGRPYKKAMYPEEIITEFKNCSGSRFDPGLVDKFLEVIDDQLRRDAS